MFQPCLMKPEGKPPFSYAFPMVFPWISAGSPALSAPGDGGFRRHGARLSLRGPAGEGAGRQEDAAGGKGGGEGWPWMTLIVPGWWFGTFFIFA